jgi:hypothetical protein
VAESAAISDRDFAAKNVKTSSAASAQGANFKLTHYQSELESRIEAATAALEREVQVASVLI